jgi:hypothetical protein
MDLVVYALVLTQRAKFNFIIVCEGKHRTTSSFALGGEL